MLFSSPSPTSPNQPEHPFLKRNVYGSTYKLVEKNILREERDERSKKLTYYLMSDAVTFIEKHIINGNVKRNSITIDDKNIEAPLSGNSPDPRPINFPYK